MADQPAQPLMPLKITEPMGLSRPQSPPTRVKDVMGVFHTRGMIFDVSSHVWRRGQVVRRGSAKPLCIGSIPIVASDTKGLPQWGGSLCVFQHGRTRRTAAPLARTSFRRTDSFVLRFVVSACLIPGIDCTRRVVCGGENRLHLLANMRMKARRETRMNGDILIDDKFRHLLVAEKVHRLIHDHWPL